MYKNVLLCYDGTAEGRRALRQGADVILCMNSAAYLLAICRSLMATAVPEGITPALVNCDDETSKALLEEGVQWLKDREISARGSLVYGDAIHHISETAKTIGADLIVLGYRNRGPLARWWTESTQESLLGRVDCSILVAMSDSE